MTEGNFRRCLDNTSMKTMWKSGKKDIIFNQLSNSLEERYLMQTFLLSCSSFSHFFKVVNPSYSTQLNDTSPLLLNSFFFLNTSWHLKILIKHICWYCLPYLPTFIAVISCIYPRKNQQLLECSVLQVSIKPKIKIYNEIWLDF